MYKICATCGENLPIKKFWKDERMPDGRKKHCGKCCSKKRGRHITPEHKRKRKTIRGLSPDGMTIQEKLDWIRKSKEGTPCACCGVEEHPCAMDYHHKDKKTKSFTLTAIRQMKTAEVTLDMIKQEIDKCVLLCAICHRKHHAGIITI